MSKLNSRSTSYVAQVIREVVVEGLIEAFGRHCSFEYNDKPKVSVDFYTGGGIKTKITFQHMPTKHPLSRNDGTDG